MVGKILFGVDIFITYQSFIIRWLSVSYVVNFISQSQPGGDVKWATFIFVILVCCILFSSILFAQNPIPNPSFENWTSGLPDEWCSDFEDLITPVAGHTGLAVNIEERALGIVAMWNCSVYFPVNEQYNAIKFYYKCSFLQPSNSHYLVFFYTEEDIYQNTVGRVSFEFDYNNNTNDWTEIEIPFIIHSDTTLAIQARISISLYGDAPTGSWFAIDDLELIESVLIEEPQASDLWIAGETDTIRWGGGNSNQTFLLEYSEDDGNTYQFIDLVFPADTGKYGWEIPQNILSTKMKIRIKDNATQDVLAESEEFKVKPYIITRLDNNGDFIAYDIDIDRWGFGNSPAEMWPVWWWLRFNYQANTDPFTNRPYDQRQGGGVFASAKMKEFPDWISWVNTFSEGVCYRHIGLGIYSLVALNRWGAKKKQWKGSCFGIAATNALAFEHRDEFVNKYPDFPSFVDPISATSNEDVIPVMNELWTHQVGNPTKQHRVNMYSTRTPNQTLNDMKEMLSEDETQIRTLSFWNNGPGGGGHTILPYEVIRDSSLYYIWVWDNAYPNNINAVIVIDTTLNGNNGEWTPGYPGYPDWGGGKWFMLEEPAEKYLNHAVLVKTSKNTSPFILSANELEINNTYYADITIRDNQGNIAGYIDSTVYDEIPGSVPLILTTGSKMPPYGYYLQTDDYSMVMNNFTEDTIDAYFFTGNKSFTYERYSGSQNQTDRLFFDGGVSALNPDQGTKPIKLLSIINDTTAAEEKLFVMKSLNLAQNDSVKIEYVNDDNLKLISYGTAKEYKIGLEYTSEIQWQIFGNNGVQLSANTTHTFVPEWSNIYSNQLMVLVDEGNNGTIDDTLYLENQVTGIDDDQRSLFVPDEYRLEQNYPNPFNSSTVIKYSMPEGGFVTLDIFNSIGERVATLVEEVKEAGNYEVAYDASALTSGIYFYQLQADNFIQTKKMILLK